MKPLISKSFHAYADSELLYHRFRPGTTVETRETKHVVIQEREVSYRFLLHQHPFVPQLTRRLIEHSVSGLQSADTDYVKKPDGTPEMLPDGKTLKPVLFADVFSPARYNPSSLVQAPYPVKDLDFSYSGAYSVYNWELFFHVPLCIAMSLSKNGRYAEAQKWFHYIFDPTDNSEGPTPQRFWKVRPFQHTDVKKIEEILTNLSTGADEQLQLDTIRSIEAWKDAPFRPHVVARYRQQAYMTKVVMAYLDNEIARADSLFSKDTGESIDEAMVHYVLAANILGPRPQPVPKKGTMRPQTYANMRADLDQFGNAMRTLESDVLLDFMPHPTDAANNSQLTAVRGIGQTLYFCVPRNDKLLGYWDTVADRLFKIRNSLNIQGVFRQLPLFEPPIDPALLVRATAAGVNVGEALRGQGQPLPLERFEFLIQKAAELCQEVKSLGNALLSAMEKEDGEAMAVLRAKQERTILEMAEHVKYGQLQEAIKAREGLEKSLDLAVKRYAYYEMQLGKKLDEVFEAIPELGQLDNEAKAALEKKKFALGEPVISPRDIAIDIACDLGDSGGKILNSHEVEDLKKFGLARTIQDVVQFGKLAAKGIRMLPDFGVKFHFWGLGGDMKIGGTTLGEAASYAADVSLAIGDRLTYEARTAEKVSSFARREQDWAFQSNAAAGEITQIFKQLRASQLRETIASLELRNHQKQMEHSKAIEQFLNEEGADKKGKKTNQSLYAWMKREVRGLYTQCYQLAFNVAKQASRTLQHQLGNKELNILQPSYLEGKEGLLAGDKLYLDIKRMEMVFHEQNQREYELTKHVSLMQLDPLALLQLRKIGGCTVEIPESLFDLDCPGHYFRRIKSIAVSIPCVTGPHVGVNCTLSLQKSSIRTTPRLDDAYDRIDSEDTRFEDYYGTVQSIVTSSSQNDSGLFETNLRDERYLPFEGSGVISRWQLQLPANPSNNEPMQFDYDSISDVMLHIRYTAREGGEQLRKKALDELSKRIDAATTIGSMRLFFMRHDFPSEWAKFKATGTFSLSLREQHYPFWSKGHLKSVKAVQLIADKAVTIDLLDTSGVKTDSLALTKGNPVPGLFGNSVAQNKLSQLSPLGPFSFSSADKSLENLWIAITWGG
jgi:hypothetical protein